MLYMIIETFRGGNPAPIYKRLRENGRNIPDGVTYVSSWVTADLASCYQVMETDERAKLDAWLAYWADLVDFQVIPVVTSAEAQAITKARESAETA